MSADFETWFMRGAVVGLIGLTGKLVKDRWQEQNAKSAAIEQSLASARVELYEAMDKWSNRFSDSIDTLNVGVARLTGVVMEFQIKVADKYATTENLKELKADFAKDLRKCAENCPVRHGRGDVR